MAKFYGDIGYISTVETRPGIWESVIQSKKYDGDVLSYSRRWDNGDKVNDDVSINTQISIVADSYLLNNMHCIRYAKLNGVAWEVVTITPQYPRLILDLGGLYNGEIA